MIPGSNILKLAQRVQRKQSFALRKWSGRSTNAAGLIVNTYERDRTFRESIQAVPRGNYQSMGLDFNKVYISIYSTVSIDELRRATSNDRVIFQGETYEVSSETDWSGIDGWVSVMCVRVSDE